MENKVLLKLGTKAIKVDIEKVDLSDGTTISFDKLVFATEAE